MGNFDHDYVVFDDIGVRTMLCMCCGKNEIAGTTYDEVLSRTVPGTYEKVRAYKYHSNIRYREVVLSDGSFADIMVCRDCLSTPMDLEKITRQIKDAAMQEMIVTGKSEQTVKDFLKRSDKLKVLKETGRTIIPAKFQTEPNNKDPLFAKRIVDKIKAEAK